MKDIKGYEGQYAITSCGRVWSHKSKRFLTPQNVGGYLQTWLYKDGKRASKYIHDLVAETYIPNPQDLTDVNHKDENKHNNSINNLEWMTHKENINYGTRTAKTQKPVYCVELDRVFSGVREASRELGLGASTVSNCLCGRAKTCGGYHWKFL